MAESATRFFQEYLFGDYPELIVFVISMLPILELRGGLIAASVLGVQWQTAMLISIIGNILPIPIILLFVKRVLLFLKDHGPIKKTAEKFVNTAMTKGAELTEKYPRKLQFALFLFVAIPLPGTGAWTGSLIAAFLGIDLKHSWLPISLGVFGASLIMLTITYVIPRLIGLK